jgi:drug/metabolite transporter (DMT)-like permease
MHRGILYALASAALFGISAPLAKLLLGDISPWLLAGLLYLGSGLGLGLACPLLPRDEAKLQRADLPWLGAAILAGGVIGPVLLMFGLAQGAAGPTSLLLNLESVLTLVLAWVVFRENVDSRLLIGAAAIVAGAVILSWPANGAAGDAASGGSLRSTLLVAGACLAWALDNNFTRKVSGADPVVIAMLKGLIAGAINTAIALGSGAHLPGLGAILAAALLGFFGYGVSLTLFVLALRHLGAARTGAYYASAPFIGAAIAILLLHEPLTLPFIAGGLLMALGLYLHLTERHVHAHAHEELDHDHLHAHDEHHQHGHGPGVGSAPHAHSHHHGQMIHKHRHYPDLHHRHGH